MIHNRLLLMNTTNYETTVTRSVDPYIPLSVKLESDEIIPHYYWGIQGSNQLIYVGIRSDNGELASISLILYRGRIKTLVNRKTKVENIIEGIPIFSFNAWQIKDPYNNSDYYSIHNGDFSVHIEETALWINLFPDQIENFVGLPGNILCFVNRKKELCGFVVENLSTQEIDTIRQFEKLWEEYQ